MEDYTEEDGQGLFDVEIVQTYEAQLIESRGFSDYERSLMAAGFYGHVDDSVMVVYYEDDDGVMLAQSCFECDVVKDVQDFELGSNICADCVSK